MFKALLASAVLLGASAASAVVTIDQTNLAVYDPTVKPIVGVVGIVQTGPSSFNDTIGVQFVTAGLTGKLSQIDLQVLRSPANTNGQITLSLVNNVVFDANGQPTSYNPLGDIAFNVSAVPTGSQFLLSLDVSSLGVQLTAGDKFAIALDSDDATPGRVGWVAGTAPLSYTSGPFNGLNYAGGDTYVSTKAQGDDGPGTFVQQPADFAFQTRVDVAPVPEPGEWAMIVTGFGIVGGAVWRRRRA